MTRDASHETWDMSRGVNILPKFQLPSSFGPDPGIETSISPVSDYWNELPFVEVLDFATDI